MELTLKDNKEKRQFEAIVEGHMAVVEYRAKEGVFYLTHTEVPEQLQGKGIASALIKKVLETLEERGVKIKSRCPFISKYLIKHPEWKKLLV